MLVLKLLFVAAASFVSGAINAVAGGGTLIVFPAMLAAGYQPVPANVSTTIGLVPGYFGGSVAYRKELAEQRARVRSLAATALVGGVGGAVLLLVTPGDAFAAAVPWLVLFATGLLALQPLLARAVSRRLQAGGAGHGFVLHGSTLLAAVYGSYFGGGLGVVLLAVLGATIAESLQRVNALKGALSLLINGVGAIVFAIWADVPWGATLVMAFAALVGGHYGVGLARKLGDRALRWVTVAFGVAVAIVLFFTL